LDTFTASPNKINPFSKIDSGLTLRNFANHIDTVVGYVTNCSQLPVNYKGGCNCFTPIENYYEIDIDYSFDATNADSAYFRVIYYPPYDFEFSLPNTNGVLVHKKLWSHTFPADSIPFNFVFYLRTAHPNKGKNINPKSVLKVKHFSTDWAYQNCNRYFDRWHSLSFIKPTYWTNAKGVHLIHKDAYKGNGALALSPVQLEDGTIESFRERNYQINQNGVAFGGAPYSQTVDTLWGFYKYRRIASQPAKIHLILLKGNSIILDTFQELTNKLGFGYDNFSIPFSVSQKPDTLRLEIIGPDTAVLGDTVLIDEIQLKSAPLNTGIVSEYKPFTNFYFYPNPTAEFLYPSNLDLLNEVAEICILDYSGKKSLCVDPKEKRINVNVLSPGLYLIQIIGYNDSSYYQKFIKE
jgi:hypothetical protein